jgi:heme a synthase
LSYAATSTRRPVPKSVLLWLLLLFALVGLMVLVGGTTRLTGSGLSMVEWRPLMGVLPPLNIAEWERTFALYKESPQYQQVNHWMGMPDFQRIFFWEWFHRLLGRLLGVVTLLPWLYFVARRKLEGRWARLTAVAFVLGGAQGALGWFMVKSGLIDVPAVSHLRLAAHLTLAFVVGMFLLWILLDATRPELVGAPQTRGSRLAWSLVALLLLQVVYGAFMAGTRAGYLYATFPDMNGAWVATGAFTTTPLWRDLIDNPAAIHTLHRWLAWVCVLAAAAFAATCLRGPLPSSSRRAVVLVLATAGAQLTLGALTVLLHVHIVVAVAHQGMAYLLLAATVLAAHRLREAPEA